MGFIVINVFGYVGSPKVDVQPSAVLVEAPRGIKFSYELANDFMNHLVEILSARHVVARL